MSSEKSDGGRVPRPQVAAVSPPHLGAKDSRPEPPEGLQERGEAVWRAVMTAFELQAHETALLVEICRTVDLLDRLQALVLDQGEVLPWGDGVRANPALVELRQHRLVLSRMITSLGIPADEDQWKPGYQPRYRGGRAS